MRSTPTTVSSLIRSEQKRACQVLLRVAPVYDDIDRIQSLFEKALIGIELQRVWHNPGRIRQHAVLGDDGITFDTTRPMLCDHMFADPS